MSDEKNENTTAVAENRPYRKTRRGYVVSDKMDKTVVVEVEDRVKHALYGKIMRRTSKLKVHDEQNSAGIGPSDVTRRPWATGGRAVTTWPSRGPRPDATAWWPTAAASP